MGDPARQIEAPRASERAQRVFAHLGMTPEQLAAADMDLDDTPLTPEEKAGLLRHVEGAITPEQLARLKADLDAP